MPLLSKVTGRAMWQSGKSMALALISWHLISHQDSQLAMANTPCLKYVVSPSTALPFTAAIWSSCIECMEWMQQLSYTIAEQGAWLLQRQLTLEYLDVSFAGEKYVLVLRLQLHRVAAHG